MASTDPADLPYAITYLQVAAGDGPHQEGRGLRVVKVTATRPREPESGVVVVRLRLALPPAIFRVIEADIVVGDFDPPQATGSAEVVGL